MVVMRTVLVAWKKGLTSFAQTYLVEIDESTAWFGRLGPGGAHWEPDYLALGMAANGWGLGATRLERQAAKLDIETVAGAGLGKVAGGKILDKFKAEIAENAAAFDAQGRSALAGHKATFEIPVAELAAATLTDKLPKGAPPALKPTPGPFAEAQFNGKKWFLIGLPETPPLAEVIEAAKG